MIHKKTKEILNNETYILAREKWFSRLNDLYNGASQEEPLYLWGTVFLPPEDPYHNLEAWMDAALEMMPDHVDKCLDEKVFRPLAIEFGLYGVHFVDKIFGAEVYYQDNQWYNRYLDIEVGQLEKPDLETNETWQLAKRAALLFLEKDVKLPVFGLPTIASALNIAVNLYGEEILVSMCIEPEAALRDLEIINDVLIEIHKWYIEHIPQEQLQPVVSWLRTQPRGYGQICGCTTHLLSGTLYEELVAPLDAKLLGVYPKGGMIHLCGAHEQHIPVWREMKELRAIQLNDRAAADLEKYFMGLRDDQIIYLNPCAEMSVEEAFKITGGKRLVIVDRDCGGAGEGYYEEII